MNWAIHDDRLRVPSHGPQHHSAICQLNSQVKPRSRDQLSDNCRFGSRQGGLQFPQHDRITGEQVSLPDGREFHVFQPRQLHTLRHRCPGIVAVVIFVEPFSDGNSECQNETQYRYGEEDRPKSHTGSASIHLRALF